MNNNKQQKEQYERERFAERLKQAAEQAGLPAKGRGKAIAAALNITPKSVSRWFTAETMPALEHIHALARILSISKEWLLFGDNNVSAADAVEIRQYPLLTTVQAGKWTGINDLLTEEGFTMISSSILASENSFFLKIEGNSMLPKFEEGDLVLIDPAIAPKPGSYVAAINGGGEATFKLYKEIGTFTDNGSKHFELIPLNPVFPTLSTEREPIRIAGVAVQVIKNL